MTRTTNDHSNVLIELLVATGQRDRQAFSRLYRLSSPKLYAVALRILKNEVNRPIWRLLPEVEAKLSVLLRLLTRAV